MPAWLTDLFARYGYFVIFAGVLLENAGVPVPGETILLAGAALARFGHLSLPGVVVVAIVAVLARESRPRSSRTHARHAGGHRPRPAPTRERAKAR